MIYHSSSIANFFIEKSNQESIFSNAMKVNKLVYLAHCWHLAIYDEPLIHEAVRCRQYGPLIETLYEDLTKNLKKQITKKISNYTVNDSRTLDLLNDFWSKYKSFTHLQLSTLSHESGTPWESARNLGQSIVPNDTIKEYYKNKLKNKN